MPDAVNYDEILIVEDFTGSRHYAICEAYRANVGDRVETAAGFVTVKKKYLDLDGEMYRVLVELNAVLVVHEVWNKAWGAKDGNNIS